VRIPQDKVDTTKIYLEKINTLIKYCFTSTKRRDAYLKKTAPEVRRLLDGGAYKIFLPWLYGLTKIKSK